MCQLCLKHGAGGKWYLNAKSYSEEVARRYNLREFLMEQYKNFEQISVRPVSGVSPAGMDHTFRMPIIGRLIKHSAEKMLHSTRTPSNPFRPEGHIGQVVPLEDAIAILEKCAAEPIIEKNCMCRYMTRGEKEACCINFGVMSEIIDKLPRFIPEKDKYHLTREEAVKRFTEHNNKGYIGTIWYGPYPYINNLCSCKSPECAGIRPRVDFGIKSIFKAEYVAELNQDLCRGCQSCITRCPFKAMRRDTATGRVVIDRKSCYGCGVCRHVCDTGALFLKPRQETHAEGGAVPRARVDAF
jgi:ferredoxin